MKRHGVIVKPYKNLGATFNPAVIAVNSSDFILMPRSVPKGYKKIGKVNEFDSSYQSLISLWRGPSPKEFSLIDEAAIAPDTDFDRYGCEDPRVTKIDDTYYIFYTSLSKPLGTPDAADGIRIAMASTKDFKSFTKHGVIGPDRTSKAGIVFKSNDKLYFMWKDEEGIERTMLSPAIDDIKDIDEWKKFWSKRNIENDVLIAPQNNPHEDFGIEPGAPPVEIDEGLLTIYSSISCKHEWTISAMLLDKKNPSTIISKTQKPLIGPERLYEKFGDVNNVVFPNGALIHDGRVYVYYGGADKVCATASEKLSTLISKLKPFQNNPI
jgi:predicted GH43/DUF377 family glycosyl hydrolase